MRISSSSSFLSIVVGAAGSGGADITAAGEVGETAASDSSPSCVSQESHQFYKSLIKNQPHKTVYKKRSLGAADEPWTRGERRFPLTRSLEPPPEYFCPHWAIKEWTLWRQNKDNSETAATVVHPTQLCLFKTHRDERVISGRPTGARAGLSEVRLGCECLL